MDMYTYPTIHLFMYPNIHTNGYTKAQGPKKGLTDAAIMLCKLNKSL